MNSGYYLPLIEQSCRLRSVVPRPVPRGGERLLYCDYVDHGWGLIRLACEHDHDIRPPEPLMLSTILQNWDKSERSRASLSHGWFRVMVKRVFRLILART
jgi:hypothetical protein